MCYLRVPFHQLAPPREFTSHTSAFFSLTAAGLFPCSQLCGAQGVCPDTTVHVWALAEVRGTYSGGSEWQIPTGSDSDHVEPSRPMQAHVQVRRLSDSPCDIWDLECCQCRQTLLGDGEVKRMPDGSCDRAVFSRIAVRV